MSPGQDKSLVTLGRIGRIHGIKGWVRLHSFTDPVANLCEYRQFQVADQPGRQLEMDAVEVQGQSLVAHFLGFDTPELARSLSGLELQVAAGALPPLPAGQFYWHQLEGLQVVNLQGQVLGAVDRLMETGANDVLLVKPTPDSVDQRERLIPWRRGPVIVAVALERGVVTVDWEADYLA